MKRRRARTLSPELAAVAEHLIGAYAANRRAGRGVESSLRGAINDLVGDALGVRPLDEHPRYPKSYFKLSGKYRKPRGRFYRDRQGNVVDSGEVMERDVPDPLAELKRRFDEMAKEETDAKAR